MANFDQPRVHNVEQISAGRIHVLEGRSAVLEFRFSGRDCFGEQQTVLLDVFFRPGLAAYVRAVAAAVNAVPVPVVPREEDLVS